MELRHLKAFLAVSDAGSFSRASIALSIAQPILSRQIKVLEEELGVDLFYRNGRGVVLTEAGRLLLAHAEVAVKTVSRATDELRMLGKVPSGNLAIGVPPTVGTILTLPFVRRFRASFPRVSLRIVEGFSGFILEWLSLGRLDVAVIYDTAKVSTLLTEPLYNEELFLIGRASPPAPFQENVKIDGAALVKLPLVLPSGRHGLRKLVDDALTRHDLVARVDVEADSLSSILGLVEDKVGYTILPFAPVHSLVAAGRLRLWRIEKPTMSRQLLLATSTSRPATAATRAAVDILREKVRAWEKGTSGREVAASQGP